MADITKIKVGQVLYDKHKYTMGNTTMKAWGVWEVYVQEVNVEKNYIVASWNGNPAKRMYDTTIKKLRVKEPIIK